MTEAVATRRCEAAIVLAPRCDGEASPEVLLSELGQAVEAALADEDVRAVVLELDGDPPLELSGAEPGRILEHARAVQALLERLRRGGKPVVAAVSGRLEAAGCALALAAHVVVAGESSWIFPRELALGRLTGFGALQRTIRRAGAGRAAHALLLGELLSATAAHEAGLVDLVAPTGRHVEAACVVAERCAAYEPPVLQAVLEGLTHGPGMTLDDALELEAQLAALAAARAEGG